MLDKANSGKITPNGVFLRLDEYNVSIKVLGTLGAYKIRNELVKVWDNPNNTLIKNGVKL